MTETGTHAALIKTYTNKPCVYFEKINNTNYARFGKTEICLKKRQRAKKSEFGETTVILNAWPVYNGNHFKLETEMRNIAKSLGIYITGAKIGGKTRIDIIDLSKPNEINTWLKMIDAYIKYCKMCHKLIHELESLTINDDDDDSE